MRGKQAAEALHQLRRPVDPSGLFSRLFISRDVKRENKNKKRTKEREVCEPEIYQKGTIGNVTTVSQLQTVCVFKNKLLSEVGANTEQHDKLEVT